MQVGKKQLAHMDVQTSNHRMRKAPHKPHSCSSKPLALHASDSIHGTWNRWAVLECEPLSWAASWPWLTVLQLEQCCAGCGLSPASHADSTTLGADSRQPAMQTARRWARVFASQPCRQRGAGYGFSPASHADSAVLGIGRATAAYGGPMQGKLCARGR
eukprot:269784-Chlamydomonas_euryale.AAC.3